MLRDVQFCMETLKMKRKRAGFETPDLRTNCGNLSSIQANPKFIWHHFLAFLQQKQPLIKECSLRTSFTSMCNIPEKDFVDLKERQMGLV